METTRVVNAGENPGGTLLRVIRWFLVVPISVAAWYFALVVGLVLLTIAHRLCPAEQVVSGMCVAPWFPVATRAAVSVGAALAAVLVMYACTFTAPTHRRLVAIVTFVAGAFVAVWMGGTTGEYYAIAGAIAAGALVLWHLLRIHPAGSGRQS
jgi:hypothetical protein